MILYSVKILQVWLKKRSDLTSKVNKSWLKKYGVNGGVDISHWYDKKLGLNKKSLSSYEVKFHKNINIHFLGDYISWDQQKHIHYLKN